MNNTNTTTSFASSTTSFDRFNQISIDDLRLVIKEINNKSCRLYPASTAFISQYSDILYPVFLHIINSSIVQNTFPSRLKHSSVTPIIKDSTKSPDDLQNIRLISNLPYLSKIYEKILLKQLETHIYKHSLQAKFQSGYRKFSSTETAMVRIFDDIQQSLNTKQYVVLLMLDSSAAFECVDHNILLNRLEVDYGLGKEALQLIKSYLY